MQKYSHHSEEAKRKMCQFWQRRRELGIYPSEETNDKISKRMMGSKNPAWHGGYDGPVKAFDYKLKEKIRKRDNYTCRECGKKQGWRDFAVHHIDFDKTNLEPSNLITLCASCHTKTNCNKREYWINYYKAKLAGRNFEEVLGKKV